MAKILIIDDNKDSAQTLAWAVEAAGHEVRIFTDGKSAVLKIGRDIPDIILCDISMPGMSGYEVCEKLRADSRFRNVLFFAQTAYSTIDKKIRSIDAGFHQHFVKPVDMRKLLDAINTAM